MASLRLRLRVAAAIRAKAAMLNGKDPLMAQPLVVHCKRARYDVYVGRPSKWGNPFVVGRDGTRDQVIARYERWLLHQPEWLAQLDELVGRTLGCWRAPKACHGEVLARLAAERVKR